MSAVLQDPPSGKRLEALRVPPHSIEAEQAVLGGLMLAPEAWDRVADKIGETDFYRRDHQLIFRAIRELNQRGMSADAVTLGEWFETQGLAELVGGSRYVIELANATPSAANIVAYAEIVREKSVLRQLIDAGSEIAGNAFQPDGRAVQELVETAERRIFEIAEARARGRQGFVPMHDAVKEAFRLLQDRYDNKGAVTGLPTGFVDLDHMTAGLQPGDLIILAARPSMGKAQPLDARVRTRTGWKTMGELEVGDALASIDGRPSIVTGIHPQGVRPVHRIRFSDGRSTECCDEHLWRVHCRHWAEPRVLSTAEIRVLLTRKRYQGRLWIDRHDGRFGHSDPLPVDPWLLGCLLGDGNLTGGGSVRFATASPRIRELVAERAGPGLEVTHAGDYDYRIVRRDRGRVPGHLGAQPNPLRVALEVLGLSGLPSDLKFIPRPYLEAGREQRLDLLRGLLDTDGWVERWGSVRLSTTSRRLADDVCELVRSLGGWCSVTSKQPHFRNVAGLRVPGATAYVCHISHPEPRSLFLLADKQSRAPARWRRQKRLTITAIEPSREAPCQCISVSHPSRLYVTDGDVVTHNTALALNIGEYAALKTGKAVAVFSMEMSASQLAFRLISSLGRINQQNLRTGDLADEEWPRISSAIAMLKDSRIFIDDTPALSPLELRQKREQDLGLIIVDYLQLMQVPGNQENRATEISEISRSLKALARELGVPLIALSQLNRSLEQRQDKRPVMADLRESGAIEQDADVILFIYRDEYYHPDSAEKGKAEVIIGKQRNGPTGKIDLVFLGQYTKFENYASKTFVGGFE
jgi:replicative DNA helicase